MNKLVESAATKALGSLFNLPQIDNAVTAYMVLDGKEYELRSFSTEFGQFIDHKGQPQSEIKGGVIQISLYQLPDDSLNRWMFSANSRKDGEIQFRRKSSNPVLRISFKEAQCVGYHKSIGHRNTGFEIKLTISPKEMSLNDVIHRNHWV